MNNLSPTSVNTQQVADNAEHGRPTKKVAFAAAADADGNGDIEYT